jgi:hypothetical protein
MLTPEQLETLVGKTLDEATEELIKAGHKKIRVFNHDPMKWHHCDTDAERVNLSVVTVDQTISKVFLG